MTQPVTAKPTEREISLPLEKNNSESSDDTHKNLGKCNTIKVSTKVSVNLNIII